MAHRFLRIASATAFALFLSVAASAGDIYVSATGNDANSGSSASAPLRTIAAAARRARAGDTVWLSAGRYAEPIVPVSSGEIGRPVTFRRHGTGAAVIVASSSASSDSAIYIAGRANIVIDGIDVDGGRAAPNAAFLHFATIKDSNRITIRNGTFKFANGWHGIGVFNSGYVTIEDNDLDMVGEYSKPQKASGEDGTGSGDVIFLRDKANHHALIQRNRVRHGGHDLLRLDARSSVAQDNYFDNSWADVVGGDAGYRSVSLGGTGNVFQRNLVVNARRGPGTKSTPPLMKVEGYDHIVRHNVLANGLAEAILTGAGSWTTNSSGARIYNNTLYRLGAAAWLVRLNPGYTVRDYVFQNNLVIDSRSSPSSSEHDADVHYRLLSDTARGVTSGTVLLGNLFAPSGDKVPRLYSDAVGFVTLKEAESKYPALVLLNREGRAQFVSASLDKRSSFELRAGSLGIDEGTFLTTVSASGKGVRLPVADTRYFTHGLGLMPGDVIQLQGSTVRAKVVSVDAASKTLVLSDEISFSKGQGVSLAFEGAAPDVGAHERGAAGQRRPLPPQALRLE